MGIRKWLWIGAGYIYGLGELLRAMETMDIGNSYSVTRLWMYQSVYLGNEVKFQRVSIQIAMKC